MVLKSSGFTRVCQTVKPTRTKNRPSFFLSRIRPANGARIRPISMVPCERKADLDEFEHGLEFLRSRVNGVIEMQINAISRSVSKRFSVRHPFFYFQLLKIYVYILGKIYYCTSMCMLSIIKF